MIPVEKAYAIVLENKKDFSVEVIPLNLGIGRALRENWYCDRAMPPYDRITMDGIGIAFENAAKDIGLEIEGIAAAGDPQHRLMDKNKCLEVMTGAILPLGCDTIIRYEDIHIADGIATIRTDFKRFQNIHWKGKDRREGELVLSAGNVLGAPEIGLGASIGKSEILVSKLPKTIVISTGNELVEIHQTPAQHQIRRSNVYRIQATLQHLGLHVDTAHLDDDEDEIIEKLHVYLHQYELIVLSGGVSMGKFDYLPRALQKLGVQKHFHKVAQRPGKPFWFGTHAKGATVFALPGNPISSFMCTQIYVVDWLKLSMGLTLNTQMYGILQSDIHFKPDLNYFVEVKIKYDARGQILAYPQIGNGSGDLANLVKADAFMQLPRGKSSFKAAEVYPIFPYR